MKPVNQDSEYRNSSAGTHFPIIANVTPTNNEITAALLKPVFPNEYIPSTLYYSLSSTFFLFTKK